AAAFAALATSSSGASASGQAQSDPLQSTVDQCLQSLAEVARLEARTAALKVQLAAAYVEASRSLASPPVKRGADSALEMSLVAEIACVLNVSEGSASAFLEDARRLTTSLPLTLASLQAGGVSWQHARIMCEESASLEPSAAAALEAHFLDPTVPGASRGCHVGELVPARFGQKRGGGASATSPSASKCA